MYMRYHYEPKINLKPLDLKPQVKHTHTLSLPILSPQRLSPSKERSPNLSKRGEQLMKEWGFFPDLPSPNKTNPFKINLQSGSKEKFDTFLFDFHSERPFNKKIDNIENDSNIKKSVHFSNIVTVKDIDGQVSSKEISLYSRNKRRQKTKLSPPSIFS